MRSFIFILAMTLLAQPALARFVVGNGGDAIICQQSSNNKLNGMYSLDYVVTLANSHGDDGLVPVKSWNDSAERIYNLLLVKAPTLAPYFKDFRGNVFNKDYSKTKVWEPTPFGLTELDDQNITSLIPENCKKDGKVQITQAVIREFASYSGSDPNHIVYKYDPNIVDSLDKNSPLQLSMLMVHEWLWDLSQSVDRNRRINRFLHSSEIESMTPEAVIANLKGMGLRIPDIQADVFSEDICKGDLMKKAEFDERYPRPFTMVNWGQLTIDRRERALNCIGSANDCDLAWKKPVFTDDLYGKYPYYFSPNWTDSNRNYPLKILSPEYISSQRRSFLQGMGQFECRITDDPLNNLECKIREPINFYYSLFGISDPTGNEWSRVVLKGVLTTECMRLKVTGKSSIEVVNYSGKSGSVAVERETVFYIHAKNGTFLAPQ